MFIGVGETRDQAKPTRFYPRSSHRCYNIPLYRDSYTDHGTLNVLRVIFLSPYNSTERLFFRTECTEMRNLPLEGVEDHTRARSFTHPSKTEQKLLGTVLVPRIIFPASSCTCTYTPVRKYRDSLYLYDLHCTGKTRVETVS